MPVIASTHSACVAILFFIAFADSLTVACRFIGVFNLFTLEGSFASRKSLMNQAATLEKLQSSKVAEYLSEKLFQNLKAHRRKGKQHQSSRVKKKDIEAQQKNWIPDIRLRRIPE